MDSVNPNTAYEELVSVRLAGMMLVIIVRQELRKNVLRYSTQSVGTGALNFWVGWLMEMIRIDVHQFFSCHRFRVIKVALA